MWALRRASTPIRNQVLGIGASYTCLKSEALTTCVDVNRRIDTSHVLTDSFQMSSWFHNLAQGPSKYGVYRRSLSSQAGARSSGEEDELEDGFSEINSPPKRKPIQAADLEGNDLFISDSLTDDHDRDSAGLSQNDLDSLETAVDVDGTRPLNKRADSELFQAIMSNPGLHVHNVLDKWVKEGKDISRSEISLTMDNLRRRRYYEKALQLSECLEANKHLEFVESDYASRVDLLAKVCGLPKAESYIEKIPESCRGELIYGSLLANCAFEHNIKKAEQVFNRMKDLGIPITAFSYNQLLFLYKPFQRTKIADVLSLMEKENVKPSLFTYKILIDAKGASGDVEGMNKVLETMKADGIEPDINTQAIMVKHYASGGLKERAVEILKEMEGNDLNEKRWVCRFLLPLYGILQMADEVQRVWKLCESDPRMEECMCAISAWGKVNNIEQAEAVFDQMLKKWKKLSTLQYYVMLKVYANHKMLDKGKDLVKQMVDNGCRIGPRTWDAIIKLCVEAGDVEKADSVLQKAMQQKPMKPMKRSFMMILEGYAGRGDVFNAEKIVQLMREVGYTIWVPQFQALLQAYIKAKTPAYGMKERLKADNIHPNSVMYSQLTQVSVLRKAAVSDFLD